MASAKGKFIELRASDRHSFLGYCARPEGTPRGGLVVLQEIFGVTAHIRKLTEAFATEGYLSVAPLLFDRVRPGIELGYGEIDAGREIMMGLDRSNTVRDISAAVAAVRPAGKVGAIGYCWGGALADLAACSCEIDAAVSYYGRHTVTWLELKPKCPVLYHFGQLDPLIPPETVAAIRGGRPAGLFHVYPEAGHGFHCDERHEYHPASAELARRRTMVFLHEWLDQQHQ
jgi:carboxymethylenebutenolidase